MEEKINMMGYAYEGYVQKMGLIGHRSLVSRHVNFGQLSSILVWSEETHSEVSPGHWIQSVLSLDGG
jgi:hypothetical protein